MPTSTRFAVAIHLLAALALAGDRPATSASLAQSVNTNPAVVRKLLAMLQRAGLVETRLGTGGGAMLARDPAAIDLAAVHRAVEDPELFAQHRQPPNAKCVVGAHIGEVLDARFRNIERRVAEELAAVSIADIVRGLKRCDRREPPGRRSHGRRGTAT